MKQWYAFQTQPHAEAKARFHLPAQGYETFFPRYRRNRSHARWVDTDLAPLFPRYLFVAFDRSVDQPAHLRWPSGRTDRLVGTRI